MLNSTMPPPADPNRINLQSTIEVNYWCQTLNCTETRLRNAIHAVGRSRPTCAPT